MVELDEPKPLIGPRGVIALFLGFLLVLDVGLVGSNRDTGRKSAEGVLGPWARQPHVLFHDYRAQFVSPKLGLRLAK
jgi:hypothetical protein